MTTAVVQLPITPRNSEQQWLLRRTQLSNVFVTLVGIPLVILTSATTAPEQKYYTYIIMYHTYILRTSYMYYTYTIYIYIYFLYIRYTYIIHLSYIYHTYTIHICRYKETARIMFLRNAWKVLEHTEANKMVKQ